MNRLHVLLLLLFVQFLKFKFQFLYHRKFGPQNIIIADSSLCATRNYLYCIIMNLEEGQEKTQPKKRKRNVNNNNNNNNNKNGIVNRLCQTCANCCRLKSKYLRVIIIIQVILLLFFSTLYMKGYHKDAWMYFSYYTRPLWDTAATPPFTVIEHFYAEDVPIEALCQVFIYK